MSSRDLLVNIKDFFVIFDPTKEININNHLLLPINSPHREEVGDSWPLVYLLSWLALPSLYLSCLFGGKTPTSMQLSWWLTSPKMQVSKNHRQMSNLEGTQIVDIRMASMEKIARTRSIPILLVHW